jgi:hypothetical protein
MLSIIMLLLLYTLKLDIKTVAKKNKEILFSCLSTKHSRFSKKAHAQKAKQYIIKIFSLFCLTSSLLFLFFSLSKMTRRTSVHQLVVKPLRKLSLLPNSTFQPDLEFVPEQQQYFPTEQQTDIISLFPREVILKILSLLCFQDLIQVQLV